MQYIHGDQCINSLLSMKMNNQTQSNDILQLFKYDNNHLMSKFITYEGTCSISTMVFFHKIDNSNNIMQPRVNHHSINHQSKNFIFMKQAFNENSFFDSSLFHFVVYIVEDLSNQHLLDYSGDDKNRVLSFIDHVEADSTTADKSYTTKSVPKTMFHQLIDFIARVKHLNTCTIDGLFELDMQLFSFANALSDNAKSVFLNVRSEKSSSCYTCFFEENCNVTHSKGSPNDSKENEIINNGHRITETERSDANEFYNLFDRFRKHVQTQINFFIGSIEGIHRIYCINDPTIIRMNFVNAKENTSCYGSLQHRFLLSGCVIDENEDDEDNASYSSKVVEQLVDLRNMSKQYLFLKSFNIKSSSLDIISSLSDPEYCVNSLIKNYQGVTRRNEISFQKYIQTCLLIRIERFQKMMKEESKREATDDIDDKTLPNSNNEIIEVMLQMCNNNVQSFWKRMKVIDPKKFIMNQISMSRQSFMSNVGSKSLSDDVIRFRDMMGFRLNRSRTNVESHCVINALVAIIVGISLNQNAYTIFCDKIEYSRMMEKKRIQQSGNQFITKKDMPSNMRFFDFRFLGM